jgi:hypothetical protein
MAAANSHPMKRCLVLTREGRQAALDSRVGLVWVPKLDLPWRPDWKDRKQS